MPSADSRPPDVFRSSPAGLKVSAEREDAKQREAQRIRPWWEWLFGAAFIIYTTFHAHGWSLAIDLSLLAALPVVIFLDRRRRTTKPRRG
jgi:hypothetical protein